MERMGKRNRVKVIHWAHDPKMGVRILLPLFKVINHMSWVTGEGLYNGSGVGRLRGDTIEE